MDEVHAYTLERCLQWRFYRVFGQSQKFIPVPLGTVNEKDNQKASENKQKAQRATILRSKIKRAIAKDKAIIR